LHSCTGARTAPSLDHVVVVVRDLERAAALFREHGFRVKAGRLHANRLLNRERAVWPHAAFWVQYRFAAE
jgi:hypothetical protein